MVIRDELQRIGNTVDKILLADGGHGMVCKMTMVQLWEDRRHTSNLSRLNHREFSKLLRYHAINSANHTLFLDNGIHQMSH
jgi:hypothetical protein